MVPELEVKPFCIGIDGVSVTVKCKTGGVAVVAETDADGYIFGLEECEEAIVVIEINLGINVFGFSVDGNKNITPAKNYSKIGRVYRKKVPIHIPIHKGKEPYTQYNENHIKLLEIGTGGYFAVWEAAIVFQNGLGFLTTQRVYEDFLYKKGIELFCPRFDGKWNQLVRFIKTLCGYRSELFRTLPGADEIGKDEYRGIDEDEYRKNVYKYIIDGVGVVDWFNVAQGFGSILTNKGIAGDAFVYYKDIRSDKRLVFLNSRQEVLYDKLIRNTSGDGFTYKAVGVIV